MSKKVQKFKLARSMKGRREQLKKFLIDHAEKFSMHWWIVTKNDNVELPVINALAQAGKTCSAIEQFEECGTSCCIGGALKLLTGESEYPIAAKQFGIRLDRLNGSDTNLFYSGYWPHELSEEYDQAVNSNSPTKMVAAAIKAIDYYTGK